jgi:hypothetical protein
MEVSFSIRDYRSLDILSGFAAWLQRNGGVVKDLEVRDDLIGWGHRNGSKTAKFILAQGLFLAKASGAPLALQSYCANRLADKAIWSNLPGGSLSHLHMTILPLAEAQEAAFSECLQQCTNLQSLNLEVLDEREGQEQNVQQLPPVLLQSLQVLAKLRHFTFTAGRGYFWASLQTLPASLQTLELAQGEGAPGCKVDIAHLHNLQKLCVNSPFTGIAEGSCLPAELPCLNLWCTPLPDDAISFLQGVQRLELESPPQQSLEVIKQLAKIRSLEQLSLLFDSDYTSTVSVYAPTWRHLPQLKELNLDITASAAVSAVVAGTQQPSGILLDLAAATSLTSLALELKQYQLPYGACVVALSNLCTLVLKNGRSSRQDMMHLTKLTKLTGLQFRDCTMDDATAVAVVGQFTSLRSLTLVQSESWMWDCSAGAWMETAAVVPVIAQQLKGLRELSLQVPGVNDSSVDLLEGLRQLTYLGALLSNEICRHLSRVLRCKVEKLEIAPPNF